MLGKSLYPYEFMNNLKKFNEASLPEKEEFYINVYVEDIIDLDYNQAKRFCKDFEIENVAEYHDLHLRSDTLLLADDFENFGKKNISFSSRLAW